MSNNEIIINKIIFSTYKKNLEFLVMEKVKQINAF